MYLFCCEADKEAQLEYEVAAEAVDPELLEAQSTIERLAKKYLVKFTSIHYILTRSCYEPVRKPPCSLYGW